MKMKMTIKIALVCFIIQYLADLFPILTSFLAFSADTPLALLQVITHMFAHADWNHFLGNFSFGLPFMVYLEYKWGGEKLLDLYVKTGLASLALHLIIMGPGLGLIGSSGALCGVAAGAAMTFGKGPLERMLGASYVSLLLLRQFLYINSSFLTNVAYWGHVGGLLSGIMLVHLWQMEQQDKLLKPIPVKK